MREFTAEYRSALPLYSEIYDPSNVLAREEIPHGVRFRLTKPFFRSVVEEENSLYDPKSLAWVGVSTAKEWKDIPRAVIQSYEDDLNANFRRSSRTFCGARARRKPMWSS